MGKFLSKPIKSTPSSYTRVLEPPITEIAQEAEDRIKKAELRAQHAEAGLQNAEGREQLVRSGAQKTKERAQKAAAAITKYKQRIQALENELAKEKKAREKAEALAQHAVLRALHAEAREQNAEARVQHAVLAQQAVLRALHAEAREQDPEARAQHAVLAQRQRNREATNLVFELSEVEKLLEVEALRILVLTIKEEVGVFAAVRLVVNEVLEPITTILVSKRKVLKYPLKFQPVKTAIKKASRSPGLVASVLKLAYVKETILADVKKTIKKTPGGSTKQAEPIAIVLASSGVDEVATLEENFNITSSVDIIEKETKITVTTAALVQQELENALSSLPQLMFGLSRLEIEKVKSALRLAAQDALKSLPIHELSELEIEDVKSAVREAMKDGLMSPDLVAGVVALSALRKEMKDVVLEAQEIAELLPEASRYPTVINQPGTPPGMLPVWEPGRCTLGMGQTGIQPCQQGWFYQGMPLGMPLNPKERDQKWDQKGRTKGDQKGRIKGYPKKGLEPLLGKGGKIKRIPEPAPPSAGPAEYGSEAEETAVEAVVNAAGQAVENAIAEEVAMQ